VTASDVLIMALKVVAILAGAFVLNLLARRSINHLVHRLIDERETREAEREREERLQGGDAERKASRLAWLAERNERAKQRAGALGAVLRSAATIIILTIAIIMVLGELNISLGPLIAGAGVVGIALGFGAQSLVRDFLSGIFIVAEDQYGVGDIVDVGEASGVVEEVTLRVTRLRDVEGTLWHVPNGQIMRVGNKSQLWARVVLDIEVAYDTEIAKASTVIKRVADEVWHEESDVAPILEEPELWGVENFGPSGIAIRLAVKTEPGSQWATSRLLRARLKRAFDQEGIEIPFPQRTIWIRGGGETDVPGELGDSQHASEEEREAK
jgi:small-conductance mechanosensitive channel